MKYLVLLLLSFSAQAATTPLVSGNGFGFVVFSQPAAKLTKFYAHPYRFVRPDPENEFAEGIETANFIQSLAWKGSPATESAYVAESHVIEAGGAEGTDTYFLPFGLNRNALVTTTTREGSCLSVEWTKGLKAQRQRNGALELSFHGIEERLLAFTIGNRRLISLEDGCLKGGKTILLVSVEKGDSSAKVVKEVIHWLDGKSGAALAERELAEVEAWRVKPNVTFRTENERKLWRQSEIVLRMGQSREPNQADRFNNGLIVASLPEGMWFVAWVRDMAYAVVALIRMGHQAEARAALEAYFNARPVGKLQSWVKDYPYQISAVRYFGNGVEEPFFTMAGSANMEFDGWGLVLWALQEYVEKFGDDSLLALHTHRGTVYNVARDLIATPLIGNFVEMGSGKIVDADTSIWEEHQWDKQHFLFSSAAAVAGLRGFKSLAERKGDTPLAASLAQSLEDLNVGIINAFTEDEYLAGTYERGYKNVIDAAALEAVNLGVTQDEFLIRNTIKMAQELRVASGGYRRVRGDTQYEKHEFLFSNFSVARNFLRLGEGEIGAPLVEKMVNKAAEDNYLVPEMYVSEINDQFPGEIGTPTGSLPMVGYGAGIYVMYLVEREEMKNAR